MRELFTRFLDLFRRDRLDDELKDEIAFHKQMLERDARAGGASSADAKHAARRQLGNITGVRERAREAWSFAWLETLQQDLRYAARGLRRSPGFTAAAVITLGLGIGANAAMFGVIDRLMFRPPEYMKDPGSVRLVYLQTTFARRTTSVNMPYTRYLDFRKMTTSFSDFAAQSPSTMVIGVGEDAREEPIDAVSASFFGFFDAPPALGRYFTTTEDSTPAGADVAVISYAYWQARYGGRDDVLGKIVKVSARDCTIVGVAPRDFAGIATGNAPSVYIPMTTYATFGAWAAHTYYTDYNWDWTQVIVRLKSGVTQTAANADLSSAFLRSRAAARIVHPNFMQVERGDPHGIAGSLKAAAGPDPGLEARTLLWVTGVAMIVLLIACANVANLFLARALRRRRETALRLALGVTRGRLVAQSLTESLVLSFVGCGAGIVIAQWGGATLSRLYIAGAPSFSVISDWRTVGVALGAALFAGVATGLAPVFLAGHDDLAKTLKSGIREGTYIRSRMRSMLLVAQGAMSVILLVGAGLFVRSLRQVSTMHLGYDATPVLEATWDRRGVTVPDSVQAIIRSRLLAAVTALPDVEHAAFVSTAPFEGSTTQTLTVRGIDSVSRLGRFDSQTMTPDYFATMETRILRGRGIEASDRAGTPPVVVVSAGMAHAIWPGKDAIGQCVGIEIWHPVSTNETVPCATVVGIAEDAVHDPIIDEPFRYYVSVDQYPEFGASNLLVRMRGDPARAAERVRRTLQSQLSGLSFVTVRPLSELIDGQRRSWILGATMFVGFGLLALVVAAVGLYGVIAYNVAQRMHELGVRVALGAQPGNILGLVVAQGMKFALAGVGVGVAIALGASRWLQPLLFRQSAKDPLIYILVGVTLLLVAVAASAVPALRAAKADPNIALRAD
ncbi:MAG TPA: ADOP family duplicated permease [Vicinamibacterales bacterium]